MPRRFTFDCLDIVPKPLPLTNLRNKKISLRRPLLFFPSRNPQQMAVLLPSPIRPLPCRPSVKPPLQLRLSRATENNYARSCIVFPGVDRHWTISKTNGMFMRVILSCSYDLIC
ncbi:hypothetical protein AVEN_48993-1 [Araneus ventricosus]|uniref:Uncharacterized protein n=1 Tax=Araneus ventricosus TaxID=182803 RepID=A0A4Y2AIM7_ARAVE|nr:hypothetical protein AVEN_48993-1 [Araneus ventricosus]